MDRPEDERVKALVKLCRYEEAASLVYKILDLDYADAMERLVTARMEDVQAVQGEAQAVRSLRDAIKHEMSK